MSHCQPTDWFAPTQLETPLHCSNCTEPHPIKTGFVALAHYLVPTENGQDIAYGNRWFCSPACFLTYENTRFMGRA